MVSANRIALKDIITSITSPPLSRWRVHSTTAFVMSQLLSQPTAPDDEAFVAGLVSESIVVAPEANKKNMFELPHFLGQLSTVPFDDAIVAELVSEFVVVAPEANKKEVKSELSHLLDQLSAVPDDDAIVAELVSESAVVTPEANKKKQGKKKCAKR